jgi:surface carbohydrate biosynthesis protein (TIGR04326 family)
MRLLLVCDGLLDLDRLALPGAGSVPNELVVFPLTSDPAVMDAVQEAARRRGWAVSVRNSAHAVGDQVKAQREPLNRWSAGIGERKVFSRSVKDWLLLPGCGVSTWWFSLLSEKNTLKTDAYLRIAQIHAVEASMAGESPDLLVLALADRRLRRALVGAAGDIRLPVRCLRVAPAAGGMRSRLRGFLELLGWPGSFLRGFAAWFVILSRGRRARASLPPLADRIAAAGRFLFISYFPAVDEEAARSGIFRNKYALALQDKLQEAGVRPTWLLMPVPLYGHDFDDALRLAAAFAQKGESLFVLEEFATPRIVGKAFWLWLRQSVLSRYLFQRLKDSALAAGPVGPRCRSVIKPLWELSFCGPVAVHGILYALMFREVFACLPDIADCLYYCEMHAWEKALNAAKRSLRPRLRTIGYQHAAVSRNDMGYFQDRSETVRTGKASDLPLPDVLACNGRYLHALLAESGYPGLQETEAVRYLYLNQLLSREPLPRQGRPVLLVAGPYDRREAKALAAMVCEAFPKAERFDIWFKGHPSLPFEEVFAELGRDWRAAGFSIKHGNISDYLGSAWAVLVPTSTVAMEALGAGCEVIIPLFPDAMLMNPLADFDRFYHMATTPEELRCVMRDVVGGACFGRGAPCREFIRGYWHLDPALPLWSSLL